METTDVRQKATEFHEEHVRLGRELMGLRELAARPLDWRSLDSALARAEPLLEEHMQFEEEDGYLNEIIERRPAAAEEVEILRLQHDRIRQDLLDLRRRVLGRIDPEEMQARLISWLKQLAEHEGRENRLVQGVANEDLGTGD